MPKAPQALLLVVMPVREMVLASVKKKPAPSLPSDWQSVNELFVTPFRLKPVR